MRGCIKGPLREGIYDRRSIGYLVPLELCGLAADEPDRLLGIFPSRFKPVDRPRTWVP